MNLRRPWSQAELNRLLSPKVGYMEIVEYAGGFSCGTCVFLRSDATCGNRSVNAPVSPDHGCCNLFQPADGGRTFPP